jgi:hypothetical protein
MAKIKEIEKRVAELEREVEILRNRRPPAPEPVFHFYPPVIVVNQPLPNTFRTYPPQIGPAVTPNNDPHYTITCGNANFPTMS